MFQIEDDQKKIRARILEDKIWIDHISMERCNRADMNISAISELVYSVVEEKPTGGEDLFMLIIFSLQEGDNLEKFINSSNSQSLNHAVEDFELKYKLDGLSATMKKTAVTPFRLKMIVPDLVLEALSIENLERPLSYKTVESAFGLKNGLSYPKVLCDISVARVIPFQSYHGRSMEFITSLLMCVFGYALIETVTSKSNSPSLHDEVQKISALLIESWETEIISYFKRRKAFEKYFSFLNSAELKEIADSVELYCKKNNFESPLEDIKDQMRSY